MIELGRAQQTDPTEALALEILAACAEEAHPFVSGESERWWRRGHTESYGRFKASRRLRAIAEQHLAAVREK